MFNKSSELGVGARVYYTGDAANSPGRFVVTQSTLSATGITHTLQEVDGKGREVRGVFDRHIGRHYFGHCNPRFVTGEAVDAFRAEQMREMQAASHGVAA